MCEVVRFTIQLRYAHLKTEGKRRWFRVAIHPDEDSFRAAARKHRPDDATGFKDAVACFNPAVKYDDPVDDTGYGGMFRLSADWLDAEVLAHEATHAAARVWRMDMRKMVNLGFDCAQHEETFAYLVGDIVQQLANGFYRHGVWPRADG